ncbi:MAG: hypothetical protein ACLUFF_07040 [Acutalibacteraceae bacterium]
MVGKSGAGGTGTEAEELAGGGQEFCAGKGQKKNARGVGVFGWDG